MSLKRAKGIGQEEDVDWNEMLNWATNFYIYMCPEEVQECLDNGAYVDTRNENSQETPLHRACLYGFRCVATVLMENGADVNAKAKDGSTPLQIAAKRHHKDMVMYILRQFPEILVE